MRVVVVVVAILTLCLVIVRVRMSVAVVVPLMVVAENPARGYAFRGRLTLGLVGFGWDRYIPGWSSWVGFVWFGWGWVGLRRVRFHRVEFGWDAFLPNGSRWYWIGWVKVGRDGMEVGWMGMGCPRAKN